MPDDVYATRSDLFRYGMPRGMLANPGRLCASALAATNSFELDGHDFENDDPLIFRAESGGALPAPIVAGTTYYAIRVNEQIFQAAAAPGGGPIDLTTDGDSVVVAAPLPIDDVLAFYSRFVDAFIPAHFVPLKTPYPITVTALVAELSAKKLLLIAGQSSQSMTEAELAAKAQLERWATGMPIRNAGASGSADVAISQSANAGGFAILATRNWSPPGGTLP